MAWGKATDAAMAAHGRSVIGNDVSLTGNLSAGGDVLIDGELIGPAQKGNESNGHHHQRDTAN